MTRPVLFAVLAATAFTAVPAVLVTPADAQVVVVPSRNSALGDRDRDGVPNVVDPYNNNRNYNYNKYGAYGDRDRDGVPNVYDPSTNRALRRDKDHDGVPNAWDRHDNNPWKR